MSTLYELMGVTQHFDTGRDYGAPQVVSYVVSRITPDDMFDEMFMLGIFFHDEVRGIWGKVDVLVDERDTLDYINKQVLSMYDAGQYRHCLLERVTKELGL